MTIDETLNNIWQVDQQRPIGRRILVYWAIISLGPVMAGGTLWATSALANESLNHIGDLPAIANITLTVLPIAVTGIGFTALFVGVPNRQVAWKDALVGGIGTAIVLEIMRLGFAYYLVRFPSYTIIYGAFATLPIFLLWIYMSWLAILLGATVAATLPDLRQRRWDMHQYPGASFVDAIQILEALSNAQQGLQPGLTQTQLCENLQMHRDELKTVLAALKELGYAVNTTSNKTELWVLSCDLRMAKLTPLVDALLISHHQPSLQEQPKLLKTLALSLTEPEILLISAFKQVTKSTTVLPEAAYIGQNEENSLLSSTQEDDHAKS